MARRKIKNLGTQRLLKDPSGQKHLFEKSLEEEVEKKKHAPVECLGMTFENDEARREHFLSLLRQGLEELHAKLGGVPFTTVEDAYVRMKSVETDLQDSKSGGAEGTPEGSVPGKARFKWPMPACRDGHGIGRAHGDTKDGGRNGRL